MPKVIFPDIDGALLPTACARFSERVQQLSRGTAVGYDDFMAHFAPYGVANAQPSVRETGTGPVFTGVRKASRPEGSAWLQAHAGQPAVPAR